MHHISTVVIPLRYQQPSRRLPLTPLIDCVFILLVFFMLQTNFLRHQEIEFAKAAGVSGLKSDLVSIAIELHDNGSVWLNDVESDMESLRDYVAGIDRPSEMQLILIVDVDVRLQRAVDVMDLFKQYDITNIAMSGARKFD